MCTHEFQYSRVKGLIPKLIAEGADTVAKITERLHADSLVSLNHERVPLIFFGVMGEMMNSGKIKASSVSLSDTTVISFVN